MPELTNCQWVYHPKEMGLCLRKCFRKENSSSSASASQIVLVQLQLIFSKPMIVWLE